MEDDHYEIIADGDPVSLKCTTHGIYGSTMDLVYRFDTWEFCKYCEMEFNKILWKLIPKVPHYSSRSIDTYELPEYEEIIKMGKRIVPFIIKDMEKDIDKDFTESPSWCGALQMIYGEDRPIIPKEFHGRRKTIEKIWIKWVKENRSGTDIFKGPPAFLNFKEYMHNRKIVG